MDVQRLALFYISSDIEGLPLILLWNYELDIDIVS